MSEPNPTPQTQAVTVRDAIGAVERAQEQRAPSVAEMLYAVVQKGVTSESVAVVEKMAALYERMQEKESEKEFAAAFAALQGETPRVKAMRVVPNNDGTPRYVYAPFEEIMAQVSPILLKHGFTVSFSTDYAEGRLIKNLTLQHVGGHKQVTHFAVRIGSGPPRANESQADGAASTYAKRFALCEALNIVIDKDYDARSEGACITEQEAMNLHQRVKDTGSNEAAFLKFCHVQSSNPPTFGDYLKIPNAMLEPAHEMLLRKENRK